MNNNSRTLAERACTTLDSEVKTLSEVLHGDENTFVALGGKLTPSVRNMVNKVQADQSGITGEIKDIAAEVKIIAGKASTAADQSANNAKKAESASQAALSGASQSTSAASKAQQSAADAARIAAGVASGTVTKETRAYLDADLNHSDGTPAYVTNDPNPNNNRLYVKKGVSGSGYWEASSFDRVTILEVLVAEMSKLATRPDVALGVYQVPIIKDGEGNQYSYAQLDNNGSIASGISIDGKTIIGKLIIDPGRSPLTALSFADGKGASPFSIYRNGDIGIGTIVAASKVDSDYVFAFADKNGYVSLGIKNNGNCVIAGKEYGQSGFDSLANQKTGYMHIFSYGQSLSRGAGGVPILSTSQPYNNKTFLSGVLIRAGDNSDIGTTASADFSDFKPLVEGATGASSVGESPISSTINSLSECIEANNPGQAAEWIFVGTAPGKGGVSINSLIKGSDLYEGMLTQIRAGVDIAQREGTTYSVWALAWTQGEADSAMSREMYQLKMIGLKNDFADDCHKITGQNFIPPFISYQTASHRWYKQDDNPVSIAQWRASLAEPDIIMACPIYHLSHSPDGLHLTNDSYMQLGKYYSRALYQTIFEGVRWKPFQPEKWIWQHRIIEIKFHLPDGQMVIDTDLVAETDNYGFGLWRNGVDISDNIVSVSLDSGNRVLVKLGEDPQPGDLLTYARGRVGDLTVGGPEYGPRGNLRDSAGDNDHYTDSSGQKRYMHNWCVAFEIRN